VTLPGTQVSILDAPPPRPAADDVGTLFVVGLTDRGPLTATSVSSLDDLVARFGPRVSYGVVYDTLEAFFAEGGGRAYVARVVGPAAAVATVTLQDAVPANTLAIDAVNPGAWANGAAGGLSVDVDASGGNFTLKIYLNGVLVETSPALADNAAAVTWALGSSSYVRARDLGGGDPAALGSAVNLAGGTDDRASITDAHWQTALDTFSVDLGPGQVAQPGRTTTAAYTQLAAHATSRNRFALLDAPDTATAATIATAAAAVRALGREQARHCQMLAPWVTVPGLTAGTTRTIPPSTVQAGMDARSDAAGGNPNRAVAGRNGISRFALDVARPAWSDTDRETLANAGVTVIRNLRGVVTTYDDVTLVDPTTDPEWLGAAGNRLVMQIVAAGGEIAEAHMFAQENGTVEFAAFEGDLVSMLTRYWIAGALYPRDDVTQAFRVETGPSVNTPQTIQQRRLIAAIALKISPNARRVEIQITNTPLTEAI
jgi:hypothetical protein